MSASTLARSTDGSSRRLSASTDAGAALAAVGLRKNYRDARGRRAALDGVSLTVGDGETLVVLGPSGAGKTTLLRVIAGLERADAGSVLLDENDLTGVPAARRRIALVFQKDALFAHMTIYENLAFALRLRRTPRALTDRRVREVAEALAIAVHLHERPARLSGGERQRASLARAVLSDPRVLLLDEPFAHLDPQLRAHVREQFSRFRTTFSGAAVHVTHDHVEALSMGDRLAIMIDGRIVQCGQPQQVYDFPANVEVAKFFGSPPMNLFADGDDIAGIRPERVRIDLHASLRGYVTARHTTGADAFVRVLTARGELLARLPADSAGAQTGAQVGVAFDEAHVRRFDPVTGTLRS